MAEFLGLIKQLKVFKAVAKDTEKPMKAINDGLKILFSKKTKSAFIQPGGQLADKETGAFIKKTGVTDLIEKQIDPKDRKGITQKAQSLALPGSKIGAIFKAPFMGMGKAAKIAAKPMGLLARGALQIGGVPKEKAKAMVGALGQLGKTALKGAALGGVFGILMSLMAAMNPFQPILEALNTIFTIFGGILEQSFMPVVETLFAVLLDPAVVSMFQQLASVVLQIVVAFLPLIQILMPFATLIMIALIVPLEMLAPVINLLAIPLAWLGTVMEGLNVILQGVLANWDTYVAPVFAALSGFFLVIATAWNTHVSPIFAGVKAVFQQLGIAWDTHVAPVFTRIKTALITIANGFIGMINGIIKALNFPLNWVNNTFGTNIPIISAVPTIAFARGGITQGPTTFLAGDNSSGKEAVIPLDDPRASSMLGGGPEIIFEHHRTQALLQELVNQNKRASRNLRIRR